MERFRVDEHDTGCIKNKTGKEQMLLPVFFLNRIYMKIFHCKAIPNPPLAPVLA